MIVPLRMEGCLSYLIPQIQWWHECTSLIRTSINYEGNLYIQDTYKGNLHIRDIYFGHILV